MNQLYVASCLNYQTGEIQTIILRSFDDLRRFLDYFDYENNKLMIMQVDELMEAEDFFSNGPVPDFPPSDES